MATPNPTSVRSNEFLVGASEWPAGLSRRAFVQGLGASLTLAGVAGCARQRATFIVPRVTPPEHGFSAGETRAYATVAPSEGFARGVLVTTHDGRPTKIEGNPDQAESMGATDVFAQASILSLYDPDRSRHPTRLGQGATWEDFDHEWGALRKELSPRGGAGIAIVTEPTTSPTLLNEIHRVLETFPGARWYQHTALGRYDVDGVQPDHDFARARIILSIQSDFLYQHPAALRYSRALAARRRVVDGKSNPPRFYALEATPTVTGTLADFRLPSSPSATRRMLDALRDVLDGNAEISSVGKFSDAEKHFLAALVSDIRGAAGDVACIVGSECDASIHRWAAALNCRVGRNVVTTRPAIRSDGDPRCAGTLVDLSTALDRGEVSALFLLDVNPGYTAPSDLDFAAKVRRVPFAVHSGEYADESAAIARWHLPAPHFLETWGDLRAYSGAASIQQPLIDPLIPVRSSLELLRQITGESVPASYDLVRETWRSAHASSDFDEKWNGWLERGFAESEQPAAVPVASVPFPTLAVGEETDRLTAIFRPDPNILDGRWASNGWLQELPKPITRIAWENAALVSPKFAAEHSLANGDVIACELLGQQLQAPVWIMPGQPASVITLPLGSGRTRAGPTGTARGFNAYRLRDSHHLWENNSLTVRKLGRHHALVSTQEHFTMEGRDIVRVVDHEKLPASAPSTRVARVAVALEGNYAWGLSIDLATCLGCNACIVACQAENNIPVVGPEQVARGREMHWLRVDRYISGDPENPRFLHQPVPCMHCENAPCELVCPVAATVHSSEGLNDMVYNRCIGTRYCSNNCPYKVRRFNFLDYRPPSGSSVYLQANPTVTVRERGVMEKCTYCVQRINRVRITAERENRAIRDGEIKTACEQACPAEAIVFGNINDPASRVSQRKSESGNYALLSELNTRPRTTYLPVVRHAPLT